MHATLYRRHRPQTWSAITGQNAIKRTLEQEIKDGFLTHAYLFSGPRGVGKTSIARIIAKAINCSVRADGTSEPCNSCVQCEEITAGRSLDVLEIDAASHTGVDHVREIIIESARFAPAKSKYKIFIIDEVHMLSISAFNALLKIMEEPPAHVIFILATTELEKVPDTIVSRCQRFDFKKIPHQEIVARLTEIARVEQVEVELEVYERIARQSEGCVRDAESLLGQLFSLGEPRITSNMADFVLPRFHTEKLATYVDALIAGDIGKNLNLVQTLSSDGVDLMQFHEQLIDFLRLLVLMKFNPEAARNAFHLNDEAFAIANKLAARIQQNQLSAILEETINAKKWWKNTRVAEMPLELLALKIANAPHAPHAAAAPLNHPISEPRVVSAPVMPKNEQNNMQSIIASVSLDEIKKKWNDLLKRVQTYHHSLPVILRMSEPIEVVGNILRIGFKYTFHRDKMKERKMSDLIERALMDVLGAPLTVEAIMITAEKPPAETQERGIEFADLIETFGAVVQPQ